MSSKRTFSDFKADPSEKSDTLDRDHASYAPKKTKTKNSKSHKAKSGSINWIKKRVRTIERRFNTGNTLPGNVRNELERELAYHKQKIEDAASDKKRKSMIKKYHMVRFHERKKADRLAKQLRTQLETTTDEEETKRLKDDLYIADIDGLYARYFPHRERYISLYPATSDQTDEQGESKSSAARAIHSVRPPLWGVIEKASKKGTQALMGIRERKLGTDSRSQPPKERPSKHSFDAKANKLKGKGSFASDAAKSRQSNGKRQQEPSPADSSDSSDDSDASGFFDIDKS